MKKSLALILTFIMVLALVPSVAFAEGLESVEIVDNIKQNGRLTVEGTVDGVKKDAEGLIAAGYTIKWEKGGTEVTTNAHNNNIAADGSWVNVAYDKGAQANYTVTISKEGTEPKTASMKVDWYDALQNGSFELPALNYNSNPPGTWIYNGIVQTPQSNVPYWKTTASDGRIELGNVKKIDKFQYNNPNYHPIWKPWVPKYIYKNEVVTEHFYHCGNAVDGDQIAELNCEGTGALYQDVLTTPGEKMNWNLSHRGRNGKDKMALVIAPLTGDNGAENVTTQKQLEDYIAANTGNSNVLIEYMENGQEWKTESGTFNIPGGQFLTRFFFVAISTSTNNLSEGNLLDHVWFSTEPIPVPSTADKGELRIVKNIVGLNEEQAKALIAENPISYKIGNETKNAQLTGLTGQQDGSFTATFKTNVEIPEGMENVNVTVTEDVNAAKVDGFILEITGDNPQTVTIEKNGIGVANFTNTYTPEGGPQPEIGTITVKKTVTGLPEDKLPTSFTFEIKQGENTQTVTVNREENGTTYKPETVQLPYGKYTVTEKEVDIQGYSLRITSDIPSRIVNVSAEPATITFYNTYTQLPPNTGTIIVKKTVSGGGADYNKAFTFTVKLEESGDTHNGEVTYGGVTFINGVATFTLKHNQEKKITEIPAGMTYTVTESDNAGYTVTMSGNTGTIKAGETSTAAFNNYKAGGGGHGHYHPDPTPVPVVVIPPKTGDMTLLQYIARLLGLVR